MPIATGLVHGAAAGAAGATALNAITYLDMALRGGPGSTTPEDTVQGLAQQARVPIPGDGETRSNRVSGLGGLMGLAAGVGVGAALGLARSVGWRSGPLGDVTAATAGALLAGNGPMAALGVTDPRTWGASDWVSDLVPHLGYGVVTASVLRRLDP